MEQPVEYFNRAITAMTLLAISSASISRTEFTSDYVYEDLDRLETLTHYAPDGTPENLADYDKLAPFDYTVRADGKRTGAVDDDRVRPARTSETLGHA